MPFLFPESKSNASLALIRSVLSTHIKEKRKKKKEKKNPCHQIRVLHYTYPHPPVSFLPCLHFKPNLPQQTSLPLSNNSSVYLSKTHWVTGDHQFSPEFSLFLLPDSKLCHNKSIFCFFPFCCFFPLICISLSLFIPKSLCWQIEKKNESLVDHKTEISFSLSRSLSLSSILLI